MTASPKNKLSNKDWKTLPAIFFNPSDRILVEKRGKFDLLARRDILNPEFETFFADPDTAIANTSHPLLKDGNSATVATVEIAGKKYVVKRYNIKNWQKAISRQLSITRCRRSWLFGHMLEHLGIHTPAPVAILEKRLGPLRLTGYIINEFCEGKCIRHAIVDAADDLQLQQKLVHDFAKILATLTRNRISHGDFKDTNFILTPAGIYLIDLDAMQYHKSAAAFAKANQKDIARFMLNFQKNPQLAHLESYAESAYREAIGDII